MTVLPDRMIYPNPFGAYLNIDLTNLVNSNDTQILIYNVVGELVMTKSLDRQINIIETTELVAGFYFYTVYNDGKILGNGRPISQK